MLLMKNQRHPSKLGPTKAEAEASEQARTCAPKEVPLGDKVKLLSLACFDEAQAHAGFGGYVLR